ncbi:hypothetical protein [Paenibacillus andongensis]|nr:hypothetical protein [Paenibacillus andongensis]
MLKKVVLCLLVAAVTLIGSGLYGSDDHAFARKVNEYEGQH